MSDEDNSGHFADHFMGYMDFHLEVPWTPVVSVVQGPISANPGLNYNPGFFSFV